MPWSSTQPVVLGGSVVTNTAIIQGGNAASETPRRPPLLDQVRERCGVRHYTLRTEQAFVHWFRSVTVFQDELDTLEEVRSEYKAAANAVKPSRI